MVPVFQLLARAILNLATPGEAPEVAKLHAHLASKKAFTLVLRGQECLLETYGTYRELSQRVEQAGGQPSRTRVLLLCPRSRLEALREAACEAVREAVREAMRGAAKLRVKPVISQERRRREHFGAGNARNCCSSLGFGLQRKRKAGRSSASRVCVH